MKVTGNDKKPKKTEPKSQVWVNFQIESETAFLKGVLISNNFNMNKTAKFLGIQRSNLYKLVKKYEIKRPDEKRE